MWNSDLAPEVVEVEKENVTVFDEFIGNPVMNMPKDI